MNNTPDDLASSIVINGEYNLKKNWDKIEDLDDVLLVAATYLDKFRTRITQDLLNVNGDRDETHHVLIEILFESTYLARVAKEYLDIFQTIEECETEDLLGEILTEPETKTKTK